MPAGIVATVDGGFATIDFVNPELRGPALAELIELGGPGSIETITRDGPRRKYRVPVGNADEVGLLDGDEEGRQWSAGADTGRAAALKAADPNGAANGTADWHTPVDQHTSANKYVGTVSNSTVLNRTQVYTGDASSFGGSGEAPTHRDIIDRVNEVRYPAPPEEPEPDPEEGGEGEGGGEQLRVANLNAGFGELDAAHSTAPGAVQADPDNASLINASLADQPSASGTDPGATPDAGGEALGDYTTVQSTRTEAAAYPEGEPSDEWLRAELNAYAQGKYGIDTSGLPNKGAVLAAIGDAATKGE